MPRNDYQQRAVVILCLAAFLSISTGCKKQTPGQPRQETTSGPAGGMVVEVGVGIGPVKFGMSKKQVIEHFGQPDKIEGKDMGLNYVSSKGLGFLLHPLKGLINIDCWSQEYPFPFGDISTFTGATKEGIKMGASRKEIEAAYGQPSSATTQDPLTTLQYDNVRAIFTLKADRLVKFSTYAPN
jgi:hypothetical protein